VTCSTLLRRTSAPADEQGTLVAWLRGDRVLAQFSRFVLVGGVSSLVYGALFLALHGLGSQPANVTAVVLSSMVANEWHRRLTFNAEERVHWFTAQWEAGSVSLIGLVSTTLALGWLATTSAAANVAVELALVGAVFATIGMLRFVALRWLFTGRLAPEPAD
jgi:putative flippase GtrA